MSDLRAMLGDRYQATIQAALLADNPGLIEDAKRIGGQLGQLMYLANVDRMHRTLTAVLPDLLARAWDEGRRIGLTQADYGHRLTMPNLTNPYRKEARDA